MLFMNKLTYYFYLDCPLITDLTSKQTIPTSKIKCPSEYIVPGFNDYLKDLHNSARNSYLIWKQNGKPRGDDTDMDMRATRLRFKYALRHCTVKTRQTSGKALGVSKTVGSR